MKTTFITAATLGIIAASGAAPRAQHVDYSSKPWLHPQLTRKTQAAEVAQALPAPAKTAWSVQDYGSKPWVKAVPKELEIAVFPEHRPPSALGAAVRAEPPINLHRYSSKPWPR